MISPDNVLINSIERFIKKHFQNKLFKGLILSALLISTVFLSFNFIEYFAYLNEVGRIILFYVFVLLFALVLISWVLIPAYKLIGFRRSMKITEAAGIIGKHFPEISDKLLNTLQLTDSLISQNTENELLIAAIEQKTERLSVIPFVNAVDFKENFKYLKIALIPIVIIIALIFVFPAFITQPSKRIILYNTHFTKPLQFEVEVLNESLSVLQNEDFLLQIIVSGEEIPDQFFIERDGTKALLEKIDNNHFNFLFKKVGQSFSFTVSGAEFSSSLLHLEVFPKPLLLAYAATIQYPTYTRRSEEIIKDQSYMVVPLGSIIKWRFFTRNVDSLIGFADSNRVDIQHINSEWFFESKILKPLNLSIVPMNSYSKDLKEFIISIDVIEDEYPSLIVDQVDDNFLSRNKFFTGIIGDDYGFSKLEVKYQIRDKNKQQTTSEFSRNIVFEKDVLRQQFFYYHSNDSVAVQAGDFVSMQFAVYDNDQVRGPKVRYSRLFEYQIPTDELIDSISKSKEEDINKRLDKALKETQDIQKELADFNKQLMIKKDLEWNDRQKAESLIEKQKQLEAELDQLKNDREKLNNFEKDNDRMSERMLEKQAKIDKLLEEVIPEDIRKMMEELQKLLQEMNKDQMSEMLRKMEMNNKEMEKQLDRNLSLLKQLQVEKEMNALLDRLETLSKELEKNAEKTLKKEENKENLSQNLEEIQKDFKKEMNELDDLKKDNEQLEEPFTIDETKDDEQSINEEMEEGQDQLNNNKSKESGSKQKSASKKMKEMKDKLEMAMQMGMEEQMAEDAAAVRFLLENVLRISSIQEALMLQLTAIRRDDPAYVDLIKKQSSILESFKVVDDSLVALSKRQPMIEKFVFDEVGAINFRINETMSFLKERVIASAAGSQQFAMMSLNNLALMLAESLKNMQESMGMPSPGQGKGKGKGKSPGKSLQNMRELQESLGNQLKNAMDGQSGKDGSKGMSEELARMAAQQEAIRQQLKNMLDQMKSEGSMGDGGLNSVLQEMEKFEEDLVNKRLNQSLIERQNDIVVRLLESEKAQKERDKEERRESNEFKGNNIGNLNENLEYKRMLENQKEILRINPIDFNPFYKQKVNQYFIRYNVLKIDEKVN